MIRLLGRNPVDCIADRRVAEVFAASHAIRPVGKPFDDLQSDMSEPVLEAHVRDIKAKWRDLSHKDEPEKARQSLIDMVQTEIERTRALAAEHEQNAGEDAVRIRALKAFENSPKAVAMRREFLKYKGSLERGLVAVRREKRARKADSDGEALPPVPGKDLSPYDGRPASWWRESGEGRRAEGGGRRAEDGNQDGGAGGRRTEDGGRRTEDGNQDGGRGQESFAQDREGDCGSGGLVAGGGSGAAVESGRETLAGGTGSVPATRSVRAGGGIRSWSRNRMFLRVGGIFRRSTSRMLRARVMGRLVLTGRMKSRILKREVRIASKLGPVRRS